MARPPAAFLATGLWWCVACLPPPHLRGLALGLRGGGTRSPPPGAGDVDQEAFGFYALLGVERDASEQVCRTVSWLMSPVTRL